MPSSNISITATYVDDDIESGVLAIWNFNQAWDNDNINAYSNDGGITTPAISFGPGISPTDNSWYQNAMSGTGITSTNLAEAITDDDYLSFTVTPQGGESVTITSIEIRPVSNGARTFALLSSINGFSDGQAIGNFIADGNNLSVETIDITGHNNLNAAVEFRIYIYDHGDVGNEYEQVGLGLGGTENPDHGANDDDLIINGSIGDAVISVTGVNLNQNTMSLIEGNNGNLSASIEPASATNQTVSWSSNNTSVATVNASGQVTAVAAGQATITVTTDDGSFTENCVITVTTENNILYTDNNKAIILHPNPATNILIIESAIAVKRVMVKNMAGITIIDVDHIHNNNIQLDISGLTKGYYILKTITDAGNMITKPFVKD